MSFDMTINMLAFSLYYFNNMTPILIRANTVTKVDFPVRKAHLERLKGVGTEVSPLSPLRLNDDMDLKF